MRTEDDRDRIEYLEAMVRALAENGKRFEGAITALWLLNGVMAILLAALLIHS